MIGIIIVAHGGLARELLAATEHVVGDLPRARAIGLDPRDDLAARAADIAQSVDDLDDGDGVVIATDLFGGTPSNLAIQTMNARSVDVISGANLPMMIELARSRRLERSAAVAAAAEAGKRYIVDAGAVLGARREPAR